MLNVVHVALTPLAGSPIRIVNALNRNTSLRARLVVLNPHAYGRRKFEGDIEWSHSREEAVTVLREAEIVHLHHFFDLEHNPFGIDFNGVCPRARFLRQFHTHPLTIARGDQRLAARIVNSEMPQLVIAQFQERLYPRARLVPNIVPLTDDLYKPVLKNGSDPILFFAPSVDSPVHEVPANATRWETKGAPETEALLHRVIESCAKGRVVVRQNIPHEQCLREKQASDIAFDELVTGSYHLSSLESLAQGLPTFAYLDQRTLHTLTELTGTHRHPWLNFRLEDAEAPLRELIADAKLRQELGGYSRDWMEKYYHDREMVVHYIRAYEDVLERPETFQRRRFDGNSRRQIFLAQRADDLVWEARKTRFFARRDEQDHLPGNTREILRREETPRGRIPNRIKTPIHRLLKRYTSVRVDEVQAIEKRCEKLLEFVAADENNRWLYQNRLERMDATLPIFDENRREFHLDRYRFAVQRVRGMRVLDCACGTGYGVRMLLELGNANCVIGADIDVKAVSYATKKHGIPSTEFFCSSGDCLAMPDAAVDVITSFETLEHVSDDGALIEEFYRVLRPGGYLIISTPNQWPLADTPYHVREYDRGSFTDVLGSRFECVELYNQNSGSSTAFNRGQARGIVPTTVDNDKHAECYLAVCRPK